MKLSKKWLSNYVSIDDISVDTLIKSLIKHTAEVDGYSVYEDDYVLDIDNKSITHRGDLWCHYGFAREIAAIYNRPLKLYKTPTTHYSYTIIPDFIDAKKDCQAFYRAEIELHNTYTIPLECSILPFLDYKNIHPVVDILHSIMMDTGQPMHAYDADKIDGKPYFRYAYDNESFVGIDNKEYILKSTDMVIADNNGVIALAGIMGSVHSSVSHTTKRIHIECALFNSIVLRKTAMRLNIHTEARKRYEKGVDSSMCKIAFERAIELINGTCRSIDMIEQDVYIPYTVPLTLQHIQDMVGIMIPEDDVKRIITALGCTYNDGFIAIPSYRNGSIMIPEDAVEEVIRLYGYDMIPSEMPYLSIKPPIENVLRTLQNDIRKHLAALGYTEMKQYILGKEHHNAIKLLSPLSLESAYLRRSIIEKALESIESPLRTHHTMHLFELDRVYKNGVEQHSLGIMIATLDDDYKLSEAHKTLSQLLYSTLHISVDARSYDDIVPDYMHPKSICKLYYNDMEYGMMGYVHPLKCPSKAKIVAIEIDMNVLLEIYKERRNVVLEPINTTFDISFIVNETHKIGDIIACLYSIDADIKSIDIVEIYTNEALIAHKKKSITLRIGMIKSDITAVKHSIEAFIKDTYMGEIR